MNAPFTIIHCPSTCQAGVVWSNDWAIVPPFPCRQDVLLWQVRRADRGDHTNVEWRLEHIPQVQLQAPRAAACSETCKTMRHAFTPALDEMLAELHRQQNVAPAKRIEEMEAREAENRAV